MNRNGTITIGGIEFDIPPKDDLTKKWVYSTTKEGSSVIRELWLDTIERSAFSVSTQSHLLSITNRGKCSLDGVVLRGEDSEKTKALFNSIH